MAVYSELNWANWKQIKQEALWKTNCLLSFDATRTIYKKKNKGEQTQTHRQQGDLISLLTKIREGYTDREQGGLISLLLFFQNKKSKLNSFIFFLSHMFNY
jgi:hypothetical protein